MHPGDFAAAIPYGWSDVQGTLHDRNPVSEAPTAIGLAILVAFYRNRGSIAVEDINLMKG
jgi:hypothetical protein